jgi:hypothetical protein
MSSISQSLPIGTGQPSHTSTAYTPCIDDKAKLSRLHLLPGILIKKFIAGQSNQTFDMVDVSEYIAPADLLDKDGIPLAHLEIAMLQLQHSADIGCNDFRVLNNLACVYALLGRYSAAQDGLALALQVAEQVWGAVYAAEAKLQMMGATEQMALALNQAEKKLQTVENAKQMLSALQAIELAPTAASLMQMLHIADDNLQGSTVTTEAILAVEQVTLELRETEDALRLSLGKAADKLRLSLVDEWADQAMERLIPMVQEAQDAVAMLLPDTLRTIINDNLDILQQISKDQEDRSLWGTIGGSQ